ncbi:MAG: RimK family alpha-L-glutamate ligase [Candidatus Bathyarchaeota archaeon]|nr:RimK family alpha-L-glutamate ligase [Candidatus Bathyarchaeota archaeon]
MNVGILTRNKDSWCSRRLREALERHNAPYRCFSFPNLLARVGMKPETSIGEVDVLKDLGAIIVRPIGRGSLEEIIFRMDLLHRLQRLGMYILNPPAAIEKAVDKFYALTLLEEAGLPVPRTIVTESADEALGAFSELNSDVVLKPLFGSRGIGSTRISDPNIAERIFRVLDFHHNVFYIQEFISHGNSDIRAFVLGGRVLAAMRRVAEGSWKTNVSLGANPLPLKLSMKLEDLAVKAAGAVGCEVAGVDILEGSNGPLVIEVNSQPGWKGLQSVAEIDIAEEIVDFVLGRLKA